MGNRRATGAFSNHCLGVSPRLALGAGTVLTVAAVWAAIAQAGELRIWSSSTGNHQTVAELVELKEDGTVVLKKIDGAVISVPLDRLSAADQEYAQSQMGMGESATSAVDEMAPTVRAGERPESPAALEAEAQQCRTAKDAVLIYKFYLAKPDLTPQQRAAAEAGLAAWEKRADEQQVRVGRQWMPKDEADKLRGQAEAKIEHAMELLRLRNGELARRTLEEASRLDPDSIKADFLMGIVYGLIADNDRRAQQHFEKCLRVEPDNVSVLNNLAVSLVFQKKYTQAIQHWKTAASHAPKMNALSQNVGSLITLAGTGQVRIPTRSLDELGEVYQELISTHGNPRPTQVAFYYSAPYGSEWNGPGSQADSARRSTESVIVSSGTGFVVHPQIILTNHHVVEDASGILVLDPKNPKGEPLSAELIASSPSLDLALVRCTKLDAPPVRLVEQLPPRGTDIMVLGYPLGPAFGTTLKSTRGAMVAMPDSSLENMCLFDAITNPGNSGGPLCDKAGRVAGVVRAVTGSIGGSYGAAIPMRYALPFVRKHVPDLAPCVVEAEVVDWPAVDAMVSPSTVLILTKEDLRTDAGVGSGKR